MEPINHKNLLNSVKRIKAIMIAVSTGVAKISEKDFEYREFYSEIEGMIKKIREKDLNISHNNIFPTLSDWYGYYSSELSTYALRRQYVNEIYRLIEKFIENSLNKHKLNDEKNRKTLFNETDTPKYLKNDDKKDSGPSRSSKIRKDRNIKKSKKWGIKKIILIIVVPAAVILTAIVTVLIFIFGDNIRQKIINQQEEKLTPQFELQYEGVLEIEEPVYEITQWFNNKDGFEAFEIVITSNYSGDKYGGRVNIITEPIIKLENELPYWEDFRNDYKASKSLIIKPYELYELSGITHDILAPNPNIEFPAEDTIGQFFIKIETITGNELESIPIKVLNTPWFHLTKISDCVINEGDSIKVYTKVKNLGAPSKFNVVVILYKITSIDKSTLSMNGYEGWWPQKTWKKEDEFVFRDNRLIDRNVDRNEEFVVEFEIPAEKFKAENVYMLETDVRKYLPYLKFPKENGEKKDWLTSLEGWRCRDSSSYSTIVVLSQ